MEPTINQDEAQRLTERSFEIVVKRLEHFGNILSEPHKKALHGIVEAFSQMAQGKLQGRWAFGLAAGLGKSSCVVAWIAAMLELRFDDRVSIAVAAEEINALDNLWAALESLHVDMSKIGMRHSKETTEDYFNKPVLLVCHARVRNKYMSEFAMNMAPYPVKITRLDGSGAVQYQTSVPSALTNVIVLDASEPIRDLEKYDRMMRSAEDSLPSMSVQTLGVPLSRIKRHKNVTIWKMQIGSGKHTMRQSFAKTRRDERLVIKEVIHVLQNFVPEDEGVSIIVFKPTSDKFGKRVDFQKVLEADLENAGIDLNETIPVNVNGKIVQKKRLCITTWGKHTATNDFSYCTTQFQIGILHRDTLDLMGNAAGQIGNLNVELSHKLLLDLQLSEVAHCSYQAMNRINCRHVENGEAKRANIWLFHDSDNLQKKLETVLEGATWLEWRKHYQHPEKKLRAYSSPTTKATVEAILGYLKEVPEGVTKVSFSDLKTRAGLEESHWRTFRNAIDQVAKGGIWQRDGRGLLRANSLFSQ